MDKVGEDFSFKIVDWTKKKRDKAINPRGAQVEEGGFFFFFFFKVKEIWVCLIFIGWDRPLWRANDWNDTWKEEIIDRAGYWGRP